VLVDAIPASPTDQPAPATAPAAAPAKKYLAASHPFSMSP